jgi:hypothetical protein
MGVGNLRGIGKLDNLRSWGRRRGLPQRRRDTEVEKKKQTAEDENEDDC